MKDVSIDQAYRRILYWDSYAHNAKRYRAVGRGGEGCVGNSLSTFRKPTPLIRIWEI